MHAVSPVVATLVLIVVAIVGAIAVGLIMSRVATDTGNQATVNGAATDAQNTLLIGGSTTIYPVTQAAISTFEVKYPVQVIDAQGGSGAGMQGVITGAINIGAASSSSAVYAAETYVTSNSIIGVSLNPTLIGGSGVVFGTNLVGSTGAYLKDGAAGNSCTEISKAALSEMYNSLAGQFYIATAACATGTLDQSGISDVGGAGFYGPFQAYSRGDNSGTADTVTQYITGATVSNYPFANSVGEQGNPGLLSAVQACKAITGSLGCIGFFDLGFAEGSAAGVTCPSGVTSGEACGVAIPEITSLDNTVGTATGNQAATATASPVPAAATATSNGFVNAGASTSGLHTFILSALTNYANINPLQTANPSANVYPDSGGSLARTFYYVINGNPTPVEQEWISFITSPDPTAQAFFHNNGYFTVYDFSKA